MIRMFAAGLAAFIAAAASDAFAAGEGCAAFRWPIEREQSLFASAPAASSGQTLNVGEAAAFALLPADAVKFGVAPGRTPAAGTFGAMATLAVETPQTIQITLSGEAWIDVVQDGAALKPSGVSSVKECPGIRRSLRFKLAAGDAALQFSGAHQADLKVAVLPAQ